MSPGVPHARENTGLQLQRSRQRNRRCGSAAYYEYTTQDKDLAVALAAAARARAPRTSPRPPSESEKPLFASRFLPNPNHSPQQSAADPLHPIHPWDWDPRSCSCSSSPPPPPPSGPARPPSPLPQVRSFVVAAAAIVPCWNAGPIGGDSIPSFYLLIRILLPAFLCRAQAASWSSCRRSSGGRGAGVPRRTGPSCPATPSMPVSRRRSLVHLRSAESLAR